LLTLPVLGCQALPGPERAQAVLPRQPSAGAGRLASSQPATRVDVLERGARLDDALERLGRHVGWNLVCEPEAAARAVTLRVFDLPWREALELLLERAGCEVAPAGERTLYVTYPPRVTITTSWSGRR
jgi:hypothetical protein